MKKAKIVCTIGPSSSSKEMITRLIEAGMDVARLNFSHGDHSAQKANILAVRAASEQMNRPVAILQDLQGPRIRVGEIHEGSIELVSGERVVLTTREVTGTSKEIPTTYQMLPEDVGKGDRILLDDGQIELSVLDVDGRDVQCEVVTGGHLKAHKGINLPGVQVSASSLTVKDREDLAFGIDQGVDYLALSFVRGPSDVQEVKDLLKERGSDVPVIAKLERPEAVENLDAILEISDGIMVARGDLGVELSPEEVPIVQKQMISAANQAGALVITATQMLESMTTNPRPTRAEASDVANAVFDGTDAVMLSGETAVGKYPEASVRMMARIVERTETSMLAEAPIRRRADQSDSLTFPGAIGHAAATVAQDMGAKAIVAFTQSGSTAMLISKWRPRTPIIAFTPHEVILRRLCLCWGTEPRVMELVEDTDEMVSEVSEQLLKEGSVEVGDVLVILAGAPVTARAETNLLKLHRVGEGQSGPDLEDQSK